MAFVIILELVIISAQVNVNSDKKEICFNQEKTQLKLFKRTMGGMEGHDKCSKPPQI